MKQRVNLYQTALKPLQQRATLMRVLWSFGILFGLLVASAVQLSYQQHQQQQQLAQQQHLLQAHTETLSNLQLALSQRQPDAQLQQQLAMLEQSNTRKQQLLNYLQHEMTTQTQGYALVLEGLAKLDPKGLWLTAFSIGAEQNQLQGVAESPALVPLWLQSLGQIPAFQGQQFTDIELTPSERKPYLLFSVNKQTEDAKP